MFISNPPKEGGFNNSGGSMGFFGSLVAGALAGGSGILQDFINRGYAGDAEARNLHWSRRAIQDRVRDAERAGIHPLYALGASTSTPMAQHMDGSGIAGMGQNINDAVQRQMDRPTRDRVRLEEQLLSLQMAKTSAETDAIRQQMALDLNRTNQGGGIPTTGLGLRIDPGNKKPIVGQDSGIYELVAPQRSTTAPGNPGVESGVIPGFQRHSLPGSGLEVLLPGSDEKMSDILENVPFWLWPSIWKVNKDQYGEAHAEKVWKTINPFGGMQIIKPSAIEKLRKGKKFFRGLQEKNPDTRREQRRKHPIMRWFTK